MAKFPITVVLEDIRSALNVGAIFRTADGAGIEKLILSGITPYPPHNRIPKTALGAIDSVDWDYIKDKQAALDKAPENSQLVAVELTEDAHNYTEVDYNKPVTLVFGNEISGVSNETLKKADKKVMVPMFGKKESLNVATTFGIVIYEIIRQWDYKT